jgi:hypothetical protein
MGHSRMPMAHSRILENTSMTLRLSLNAASLMGMDREGGTIQVRQGGGLYSVGTGTRLRGQGARFSKAAERFLPTWRLNRIG